MIEKCENCLCKQYLWTPIVPDRTVYRCTFHLIDYSEWMRERKKRVCTPSMLPYHLGIKLWRLTATLRYVKCNFLHWASLKRADVYISNDLLHIRIGLIGLLDAMLRAVPHSFFSISLHSLPSEINGKAIFMPIIPIESTLWTRCEREEKNEQHKSIIADRPLYCKRNHVLAACSRHRSSFINNYSWFAIIGRRTSAQTIPKPNRIGYVVRL